MRRRFKKKRPGDKGRRPRPPLLGGERLENRVVLTSTPVLDTTKVLQLSQVLENSGPPVGVVGTPISALIDADGGLGNFSDADGDLPGIAITDVNLGGGTLWLSENNGLHWVALSTPTEQAPIYIAADEGSRIYFEPAPSFYGEINQLFSFRAWDRNTYGSYWEQIGSTLSGYVQGDRYGIGLSLSADGRRIAIGTGGDPAGASSGITDVFNLSDASWGILGSSLTGNPNERFGDSLALSGDGNTLVVASIWANDYAGAVRTFRWDGSHWQVQGDAILGDGPSDYAGWDLALSDNGNTLVVSALGDSSGSRGVTRIFSWDENVSAWRQLGADIRGSHDSELLGWSAALSADGRTVAISSLQENGLDRVGPMASSYIQVYSLQQGAWAQVGATIYARESGNGPAQVALSGTGERIIIGYPSPGYAAVYDWSGTDWRQVGPTIDGEIAVDFGKAVDISDDGSLIFVGAPKSGEWDAGTFAAYRRAVDGWQPVANVLTGSNGESLGSSVSASALGDVVAVARPGSGVSRGSVSIHRLTSSTSHQLESVGVVVPEHNWLPQIDPVPDITLDEDSPTQLHMLTGISSGDPEPQQLRVFATSSDPTLIPHPSVSYVSPEATAALSFMPSPNRAGAVWITVTIEDGGLDDDLLTTADNASSRQIFQVVVNSINDSPSGISLSSRLIANDAPIGALIGTFSTHDADDGDTFTYTLTTGDGDADNASFQIIGNELRTRAAFSTPTKDTYSVRVRSTDAGGLHAENQFPVYVTDIGLSQTSIAENSGENAVVGELATINAAGVQPISYSLVGGSGSTDNALFNVFGNQLRATQSLDFESQRSYSIRLRSTDAEGTSFEKTFAITATDVNEPPSAVRVWRGLVELVENTDTTLRMKLADILISDDALGDETITLSGEDAALFEVDGLELYLRAGAVLDREAGPRRRRVTINARDESLPESPTASWQFLLDVADVNEAPTEVLLWRSTVDENAPVGTAVGNLYTTDPDAFEYTFEYSLTSGAGDTDNALFSIAGNRLLTAAVLDFEAGSSYTVRIRSTDSGGLFVEQPLTVTVSDVNEPPTNLRISHAAFPENAAIGTPVGAFQAIDPDDGDTITYSLVAGNGDDGNTFFEIVGNELRTKQSFDFEEQPSYSIRVRASDSGGLTVEEVFSIDVLDIDEGVYEVSIRSVIDDSSTPPDLIPHDGLSRDNTPEFRGTAKPRSQVSVAVAGTTGTFSFSSAQAMSSGLLSRQRFGSPLGNIAYASSHGIGATGGGAVLTTAASDTVVLQGQPQAATAGTTIRASLMWKLDDQRRNPFSSADALFVGLVAGTSPETLNPSDNWGIQLLSHGAGQGFTPQLRTIYGIHTYNSADYRPLNDGHWYKTTAEITLVGGTFDEVRTVTQTFDCGESGLSDPAVVDFMTTTFTGSHPEVFQRPTWWPAFRAHGNGGIAAVDNFSVSSPERMLGLIPVDQNGFWTLNSPFLLDGHYTVTATGVSQVAGITAPASVEYGLTIDADPVNRPPRTVVLANAIPLIQEGAVPDSGLRVADILIDDDSYGTTTVLVSGPDATLFEIAQTLTGGYELRLKAGVDIDYESRPLLTVVVSVSDPTLPDASPIVSQPLHLEVIPRSPHLTTGTNGQLFVDGQSVMHAGSPATASFQSWTIFEAGIIRGENVLFGQHRTGVIHRLHANADWSLVGGLHGVGNAYSIDLPRSARGPEFPEDREPEPLPADLLIPLETSGTQLRVDAIGQLYANDTLLTWAESGVGITFTDLAGYKPIAVVRENQDSAWQKTLLWQHHVDHLLVEWQLNSSGVYQSTSRVAADNIAALELAYQVDINRDGRIG